MSETNPTNDDLHDSATDRLLAEAIGGEAPPDLRDAIVERFESGRTDTSRRREGRSASRARPWVWLSVAALLLVGATLRLSRPPAEQRASIVALENGNLRVAGDLPAEALGEAEIDAKLDRARGILAGVESADPKAKEEVLSMLEDRLLGETRLSQVASDDLYESVSQDESAPAPESGLVKARPLPALIEPRFESVVPSQSVAQRKSFGRGRGGSAATAPTKTAEPPINRLTEESFDGFAAGAALTPTPRRDPRPLAAYGVDVLSAAPSPAPASSLARGGEVLGRRFQGAYTYEPQPAEGLEQDSRRFPRLDRYREPPSRDRYTAIQENPFFTCEGGDAVSTFSCDVDTASYANVRQYLIGANRLPPADAVRVEELVNYFEYRYEGPEASDEAPFAAAMEVGPCPWTPQHRIVRIGVKGREIAFDKRPLSNLVFLVDVSGSMNEPNKLPLLVDGLKRLTRQLGENDRVAIVVYASSEGLALPSCSGSQRGTILAALDELRAGGSTAGGAGIQLAYDIAERNLIEGGVNRVLLCTDGDFNVGVTDKNALGDLVERKARETGVFLSVLGFGRGNLNDAMMETISGRGNGVYAYVDSDREAHRVLVRQMSGTLVTIAKDVKLQVEFNPQRVAKYRLIGYENRVLKTEDFNDDTKDAGEIGAGHTVTALYEVVPVGATSSPVVHEPLKYQPGVGGEESGVGGEAPTAESREPTAFSNELLTLKIRYKQPDANESAKLEFPLEDDGRRLSEASPDFKFACGVAEFGMLLRNSRHRGAASFDGVLELAEQGLGDDPHGDRSEFVGLVRKAKSLRGER